MSSVSRIPQWSPGGRKTPPYTGQHQASTASQHQVTADVIDEAVDSVFNDFGVQRDTAEVVKNLLSTDVDAPVAHSYYHGVASKATQLAHIRSMRKELLIPYVLDERSVTKLTEYASDFKLRFRPSESHDHPMGAATRKIDRAVVESRLPPGLVVSDLGAAVLPHIMSGRLGYEVHACVPVADSKDPGRREQEEMRARRIAGDVRSSSESVVAARKFLTSDRTAVCGSRAQDCDFPTPVLTAVHVYDIPIEDWPSIIHKKKARLVEGCMIFSPKVFEKRVGTFDTLQARYEVDVNANTFSMGFIDSPAWWYQHSWTDYLKYGVDQILRGQHGTYSYKIVERRGDTIFFRILPVSSSTVAEYSQVYRLPEVAMVSVQGFEVTTHDPFKSIARREYIWPMPLWEDMLTHASLMLERGTLDHERMFNYYRTVAPRQTINSVRVAGGYTVEREELVPLVVHCVLVAAASVFKTQAEVTYQVAGIQRHRRSLSESTCTKVLATFSAGLKAMAGLVCFPLACIEQWLRNRAYAMLATRLVEWEPVVSYRNVNMKLLLPVEHITSRDRFVYDEDDFLDEYNDAAPYDHVTAAEQDPRLASVIVEMFADVLPQQQLDRLASAAVQQTVVSEPVSAVGSEPVSAPPSYRSAPSVAPDDVVKIRRDAVLEAIQESESEQAKIQASCFSVYRELTIVGKPDSDSMRRRAEEYRNPDFWWVSNGILERSVSGLSPTDFLHAALFIPYADPRTGTMLYPVYSEEYKGMSRGEYVEREYMRIAVSHYTGWAFVNDSLMIYNGPEIVDTLRRSLDKSFAFSVRLYQGPPGCGKTTSIVKEAREVDVVLCPVRESARDTKMKLIDKGQSYVSMVADRCRTLDSFLVNYGSQRKLANMKSERVLADEVFMARAGKWYAAAALLGASELLVYGDMFQIPHVPRATVPEMHVKVLPDVVKYEWLTYRCPADAVAAWNHIYDWKVRTKSVVQHSIKHVVSAAGLQIPVGCVMMGMYQADKKIMRAMYAKCGTKIQIMTVHEAQGKTFEHVWLHRFDNRRRVDDFCLYDKQPYVLVATSRHTKTFVYVAPDLGDQVIKFIQQARDLRRVNAAADVSTAGVAKQFL